MQARAFLQDTSRRRARALLIYIRIITGWRAHWMLDREMQLSADGGTAARTASPGRLRERPCVYAFVPARGGGGAMVSGCLRARVTKGDGLCGCSLTRRDEGERLERVRAVGLGAALARSSERTILAAT